MLLPTGQVLFSPSSSNVQCYTPVGGPEEDWRPTVSAVIRHGTATVTDYYLLKGTQLNGWSQANVYGDDCSPCTNYPLVRLRNVDTNEVHYCRTYDFSTMGVATGHSLQSVRFTTDGVPHGHYDLCVVANGIDSDCVSFRHHKPKRKCGCSTDCCCEVGEETCCEDETGVAPEVLQLQRQVYSLQRGFYSLAARIQAAEPEPEREPKQTHKDEDDGK